MRCQISTYWTSWLYGFLSSYLSFRKFVGNVSIDTVNVYFKKDLSFIIREIFESSAPSGKYLLYVTVEEIPRGRYVVK